MKSENGVGVLRHAVHNGQGGILLNTTQKISAQELAARKLGLDFTEGNITKLLLQFFTPFLLASILNSIYNTVDMVVIGRFEGSVGTVAVSQGGKMLNLFTMVGSGLSTGGQVLVAQQLGANQKEGVKTTIGTLFSLLGILSVLISVVCLIFSRQLLVWMNTPQESFSAAMDYFKITCIGLPLLFGYTAVSSILRGMGDSKNPLLFIAVAAVINLILDIVFIVQFNMGAAGTALATVIGQGVSFLFSVALMYRRREDFSFDFMLKSFAIDRKTAATIQKIGLPLAARSGMIHITQLYIMRYVNAFGLVEAAAYGIGDKIIHLSNIVTQSINQSGSSIVAQNIGANRCDRVREVVHSSMGITVSFAAVLSILSCAFPHMLFSMFTSDDAVMAYSADFMKVAALVYFLSSIAGAFGSVITGTGNSSLSFLAGFLDGVIFRIAFSFFFGFYLKMGVTGFFLGNALARLGPLLVGSVYYLSGAWKRRKRLVD